jgi:Fe-S cluster assembly iron-binding protein IscA
LDIEEYKRIFDLVDKKFGFDKKIPVEPLTSNKGDVTIEITGVSPKDNKIDFQLRRANPQFKIKNGRAKLSTIEKLISNYQLFDPFED